jgi:hypothetical protein
MTCTFDVNAPNEEAAEEKAKNLVETFCDRIQTPSNMDEVEFTDHEVQELNDTSDE